MTSQKDQSVAIPVDKELVIEAVTDALNLAALGESCVHELRAILAAIFKLSSGNEVVRDLAKVGVDLANDRHNMFDVEREVRAEKIAALKGGDRV